MKNMKTYIEIYISLIKYKWEILNKKNVKKKNNQLNIKN